MAKDITTEVLNTYLYGKDVKGNKSAKITGRRALRVHNVINKFANDGKEWEKEYTKVVKPVTPGMGADEGMEWVVFFTNKQNPLNSAWAYFKTKEEADAFDPMVKSASLKIAEVSQESRDKLMDAKVTLNGKPAVIRGRKLDFPVVTTLDGQSGAEFSWEAVDRIVNNGGNFKTASVKTAEPDETQNAVNYPFLSHIEPKEPGQRDYKVVGNLPEGFESIELDVTQPVHDEKDIMPVFYLDSKKMIEDSMTESKQLTRKIQKDFNDDDNIGNWLEWREEWVTKNGGTIGSMGSGNTYNGDTDGDVFEWTDFENVKGQSGLIIMWHEGKGDVRVGYGLPVVYIGEGMDFLSSQYIDDKIEELSYIFGYQGDKEKFVHDFINWSTGKTWDETHDFNHPDQMKFPFDEKYSSKQASKELDKALEAGIKVEKEHKDTYESIKAMCGDSFTMTLEEFAGKIAQDHLNESKFYYDYLKTIEEDMKKDTKEKSDDKEDSKEVKK